MTMRGSFIFFLASFGLALAAFTLIHKRLMRHTNLRFICSLTVGLAFMFFFAAATLCCFAEAVKVVEDRDSIRLVMSNYVVRIEKKGFRYGFSKPCGEVIAPPHAVSGLEYGGSDAVDTVLRDANDGRVWIEVTNSAGESADVEIHPSEHYIRFSFRPRTRTVGRILARMGGVGPAFGLGDLGVRRRDRTELTGYVNEDFHGDGSQCERLISNFVIFPQQGLAEVNIEPTSKVVRITPEENAQGIKSAAAMPALYYFFGNPERIYADFLAVRNLEGYRVFKPKYELFGVGWEAFGALGWNTNEKTVTENVERYLSLGYPLSWMVVGSGFWSRQSSNFLATTSFGLWDTNAYPHPRELIQAAHERGLKFLVGLRISFITNGPYASEGLRGGYFIAENGQPKVFNIAFPKSPCYLLDSTQPEAVRWYAGLCQKWLDYGVDGFKEDLFGYAKYTLRDDKLDPVNAALMERSVYIMGRNGYLGSPMDLHRFEDFNYDQWQDRGPINGLAFAYSGFPYVYPDIVGGTFGEGHKMGAWTDPKLQTYIMRNAQYASVNPSMSMGIGPWNFQNDQVEQVMLKAARLHAQLHPYIYSAAVDAFETGFPYTLTPLPLVWPDDPEVYKLENAQRHGYQWMLGPSLLAVPLYGDDYATAKSRDVYLPSGKWMDYDTGEVYMGPKVLTNFSLPPGKTPLFVGGKGVLVLRVLPSNSIEAVVYPVAAGGSTYRFTGADGATRTTITSDNAGWNADTLKVTDRTDNLPVSFRRDSRTGAIRFGIIVGHNYRLSGETPNGNEGDPKPIHSHNVSGSATRKKTISYQF